MDRISTPTSRFVVTTLLEPLERRRLLTTIFFADLSPGLLEVTAEDRVIELIGTDTAERVEFAAESDSPESDIDRLDVYLGGELRIRINAADTLESLDVNAAGGDDTVILGRNLPQIATRVFGGDGEDLIGGSGGAELLDGGAGNDTLDGNPGGDLLVGGAGDDTLYGGRLGPGEGVIFDAGDIEGEGILLAQGDEPPLRIADSAPFDAVVTLDLTAETGRLETRNTTLLDLDVLFGDEGTDTGLVQGRVLAGSELESVYLDRQGPLPAPQVDQAQVRLALRPATADPALLDTAAVTVSAQPTDEEGAAAALESALDDVEEAVEFLANRFGVSVQLESSSQFSRTFAVPASQFADDGETISLANARESIVSAIHTAPIELTDDGRLIIEVG